MTMREVFSSLRICHRKPRFPNAVNIILKEHYLKTLDIIDIEIDNLKSDTKNLNSYKTKNRLKHLECERYIVWDKYKSINLKMS